MARRFPLNILIALTALPVLLVLGLAITREFWLLRVFSFLSVTKPVNAEVLVIEGWLSDPMLKEAATEFGRGKYSICLISGKNRFPQAPVQALIGFGVHASAIRITEAEMRKHHKTYNRALAAGQWLEVNRPEVRTLNVFTAGPHGRKSWTIFKRVFGGDFSVGVISSTVEDNDPGLGWKSPLGVRNMARYAIGYLYARVWPFDSHPARHQSPSP